tara:strand:- start:1614 stop:4316 length:2703 start_codon:yes stop_codon:yes gene_type:complete
MSYAQQFADQTQSYNSSLDSYWQGALANHETRIANAGRANEGLLAFAELGQTVAGKLAERKKYLIEQSKLKLYNEGLMAYAEGAVVGPTGDSPEEIAAYNLRIEQAYQARQQGKPVELGHKILNIGEHDRRHFQQGLMAGVASQQNTVMQQIINDEKLPTGTERELAGSMATAFTKYLQRNVMSFDERVVLSAMPTLHKNFHELKQKYTSANNIRNSEFTLQRTKSEFGLGLVDYSQALKLLQGVVNPTKGANYTSAEANKIMTDHMKYLAKNGALSNAVKNAYFDSKPEWAGGRPLREVKSGFLNEINYLQKQFIKERTETEIERAKTKAKADADAIFTEFRELIRNNGGQLPPDVDVQALRDKWRYELGNIGQDESWFSIMVSDLDRSQLETFEDLQNKVETQGYIASDNEDLSRLSMEQQNTLRPFIVDESEANEIDGYRTDSEDDIKSIVAEFPDMLGQRPGSFGYRGRKIIQNAMADVETKVAKLVRNGSSYEDAYRNATAEVVGLLRQRDPDNPTVLKIPQKYDTHLDDSIDTNQFRKDLLELGTAMDATPYQDLTSGQYTVPKDVVQHLRDQDLGLIKGDHKLVEELANRDPRMSRYDVRQWLRKAIGMPYKAPVIDGDLDGAMSTLQKMSHTKPGYYSFETANSPASAERNIIRLMSMDTDANPFMKTGFTNIDLVNDALWQTSYNPYILIIGINEGTLRPDGTRTDAATTHIDAGDNKVNIGIFSANSDRQAADFANAAEADAYHTDIILNQVRKQYVPELQKLGVPRTTDEYRLFMSNILDLHNQSGHAGAVSDFTKSLRTVIDLGLRGDELVQAVAYQRARAYIDPKTNRLVTSFKPTKKLTAFQRLFQDQLSRAGTAVYGERRSYTEDQILDIFNNNPVNRRFPANII